jgi:hypothetical protein
MPFDRLWECSFVIDQLANEVGQNFRITKSEDAIEFQARADAALVDYAEQIRKCAKRANFWWLIATGLAGFALSPLGWGSAVAGAIAVAMIQRAARGEYMPSLRLERAAINVAQSKQDYCLLEQIERLWGAR